jgi:DNA-binding transcriptional regulator YiaG
VNGVDAKLVVERIRIARLALGLSRPEFARFTGVGLRSFEYWDVHEREPAAKSVRKIAAATGRPVGWFYGIDEQAQQVA